MNAQAGEILRNIPDCPRCGYELRGLPVPAEGSRGGSGQCPECGLVFQWHMLLDPLFSAPGWFVELEQGGLIATSLRTTAKSLLPWNFWRSVQMGLPRRIDRAIASVFIGFLGLWVVFAIVNAISTIGFFTFANPFPGTQSSSFVSSLAARPLGNLLRMIAPENLGLLGSVWLGATYIAYVCVPFTMLLLPQTLRRARVLPQHIARISFYSVAPMLVMAALPPIIRSVWWMIDVGIRGDRFSTAGDDFVIANNMWLRPTLTFLAILLTWGFACSRYLKLPQAWLVAASLAVLSTLLGVLFTILTTSPLYLF